MSGRLPIYEIEDAIVSTLREHNRLILSAPTGSGKSTQLPQMLLRNGLLDSGQVVILQPRRLATRLLANRVAHELGCRLGGEVGYQIRFENITSTATRIRFVTEGVLLRQLIDAPDLPGVSTLILDEFHERHLYGDITLSRALEVQESLRPDLRIVVMSATLDTARLADVLGRSGDGTSVAAPVLASEGRTFPVDVAYSNVRAGRNQSPVWELAADAYAERARSGDVGDALVFMPGAYEIHRTMQALKARPESRGCLILPLHGELAPSEQDAAVTPESQPRIIVSTNVAETSVTIDGIRLVIDSGLARIPRYDPYRGINTLLVEPISHASADQRTGRAGRTGPGECIRLWSEAEHRNRVPHEKPEVQRLDLSETILMLKAAGVEDLESFRWIDRPDAERLRDAETLLLDLGALRAASESGSTITDVGRRMLKFPLHPRYARMLLAAEEYGCVHQAALIAALTQGRDILIRRVDRDTKDRRESAFEFPETSDFFALIAAWSYGMERRFDLDACKRAGVHAQAARQVGPVFQSFLKAAEKQGLDIQPREVSEESIRKCILAGFSDRVARRVDQGTLRCELVHGRTGTLARESIVQKPSLVVAAEIREIGNSKGELNTLLTQVTEIEPAWLEELFPGDLKIEERVEFDRSTKRVVAFEERCFHGLAIESRRIEPPPAEAAARVLASLVLQNEIPMKGWDHGVDQWILRTNLLSRWCPEYEIPEIGDEERAYLVEQICVGAVSAKDVRERPARGVVMNWLSPMQKELVESQAPERVALPNGKKPKVSYSADNPPYVSLRIQEMYELKELPKIAGGKVQVIIHVLAPNMRPVQVTSDLQRFWSEHYPKIKSELQRRYPKHEWR